MNKLIVGLRRVPIRLTQIRFKSEFNKRATKLYGHKQNEAIDLSKTFDALDSSSVKTMEKILDILHDAEEQSSSSKEPKVAVHGVEALDDSKYMNEFATRLGEEILEYKVIRHLNDKEVIANNSSIWGNIPSVYGEYVKDFISAYVQMNSSFFKSNEITFNGRLNYFQSITKYFIENDSRCLQRISREIEILERHEPPRSYEKKTYNFPRISLPPPYPYDSNNPLVIMKAFSTKKELNLLPFIINDADVIENLIVRNQNVNKNEITPSEMIQSMMEAQELEGSKLFTIMIKKSLYATNQLNNQVIIDDLINNETMKSIIACESRIPSRLFSYNNYKIALSKSNIIHIDDDLKILELLKSQFDRFFALFYRISAFEADKWANKLVEFYGTDSPLDTKNLSNSSIKYFKDFLSSVEMELNKAKWTKKWQ